MSLILGIEFELRRDRGRAGRPATGASSRIGWPGRRRRTAPYGGVVPEIAARAHVEILPPLIEAALAEAGIELAEVDAIAATAGPGPDRRRDGRAGHRQGAGAGGGQAADRGQSSRRPCAVAAAGRSRSRFPLSAAAGLGRALPVAAGRGRRRAIAGSPPRSTMPPARRSTRRAKLLGLGFPGGPAVERAARDGRSAGGAAAAAAGRLAPSRISPSPA